jgi:acyl dehydratase
MAWLFEEFTVGQILSTAGRTVGEGDIVNFAGLVGDYTPIHVNEHYAATTQFGGRIAHGPLTLAMAIGLLTQLNILGDSVVALLNLNWDFKGPVKIGDTVYAKVTINEARASTSRPGTGVVKFGFVVVNQRDETVQAGVMTVLIKGRQFVEPSR